MLWLSLLTFLPTLFALVIWVLPNNKLIRPVALGLSLVEFAFSLILLTQFDSGTANLQFVEQFQWVELAGIQYFLGVDGISIWLVMLTTFLLPITVLGSWTCIKEKSKGFHVSLFVLTTTIIGTFLAFDAILFYTFFEASLIPMYFMIGIWGGKNRIYASIKFFIYTMLGSVFLLLSIIALMFMAEAQLGVMSSSLLDFYKLEIPFVAGEFLTAQTLLFFGFALAFAIKVPLFPFHTWLPDAHVEAPTPGSVILAGVMLKMGTYGLLRFSLPLFPEATQHWGWIFFVLGIVGIIYGALVAMIQADMKKLVAYSSVSHMGYIVIGLFAMNVEGTTGAIYQMLNHGISTGALFLLVGMIYERTHSREIKAYGGLAVAAPIFTIFFIIVTLSSIAVPMTNGFIGEYLILLGTFLVNKVFAVFAVSGVVLGACYMLWMIQKVFFGPAGQIVTEWKDKNLDINLREIIVLSPMVLLIFWMGIFPNHFISLSEKSINHLMKNKNQYYLSIQTEENKDFLAKKVK